MEQRRSSQLAAPSDDPRRQERVVIVVPFVICAHVISHRHVEKTLKICGNEVSSAADVCNGVGVFLPLALLERFRRFYILVAREKAPW